MPVAPEALLEHTAFVRRVARAALRGDDLVDDVVQDTMLTALEEAHRRRGPLRAWLAGVARNKARNLIRRRAARRRREERVASGEATDSVDELVARAEEGRRLVAAVLALDERYKRPILLRYYEGLPPREIAQRLDIPVETARTRIKRGIDRLRSELQRTHEREPGGWRVALLPLSQLPARGPGLTPALVTGGAIMGKKGILWATLLIVLIGGGLWLRPWADNEPAADRDAGQRLSSETTEPEQPRLRGLPTEPFGPSEAWPSPIDFAKIDRDRDLHGIVVRADGSPVAGASVTVLHYRWRTLGMLTTYGRFLESDEGPSSVSGADGSFALSLKRGDLVHLRVRAAGLATTELTYLQAGERVRVVLGEAVRLVVSVTDAAGAPVRDMPVRFFVNPERTGRWLSTSVTTGQDGQAVFAGLPGGLKGWLDSHPNRAGVGSAGWVEIELPAAGELQHRMELPAGKSLRGRVTDATTGEPIQGARVSTNWAFLPAVETDAEGRYVLHGWTPRLGDALHAVAPGFVQSTVPVPEDGESDVRLAPGLTLRGRVVDGEREPVPGALVSVCRMGRGSPTVSLGDAVTDAKGEFEVRGLDWSALVLLAQRAGLGRLVHVVSPGTDRDLGDLALPPRCEISGTLTEQGGQALARVPVTVTPVDDLDGTLRRLERRSDDLGRFRFPDLGPAAYEVAVGPRFEPILRERVELSTNRPVVELDLTPNAVRTVVVRAVDTAGRPAAGVHFQARAKEPADLKRGSKPTGEDGVLTLELPRRPYELSVQPRIGLGFALRSPIRLDAMQTSVEVVLERLVAIRGRLVTPDGKPIAWGFIGVEGEGDRRQFVLSDAEGAFVAYVSAGARVTLTFRGNVQNTMRRIHEFVPYTASVGDIAAGMEGLVLRTTALDTDRELTVRLLDPTGKPVAEEHLQIAIPPNEHRPAQTQSDGRAHWRGLPAIPLRPTLRSWRATREQPWIAPRFETVTPDGRELTARFRQGSAVEGTVLKADGAPAPFAYVQILEDGKSVRGALADADGRFVAILDPEWRGRVSLRCEATAPGGQPKFVAVEEVRVGQEPVTLPMKAQD